MTPATQAPRSCLPQSKRRQAREASANSSFTYEVHSVPAYGTCYAWVSQPTDVQDRTVATLAKAPFNKIRMCVFPKFYDFNTADPWAYAYPGTRETGFDHTCFDEEFFANLDCRIAQLDELGIEADIILLHPYDKPDWGFSKMTKVEDEMYLAYMARRYGAYKNVWWSLANEYDLMPQKSLEDWREYARVVMANDAFGHLRSIHNCIPIYDYNEPWCTHCSIQRVDVTRTTECIADWRKAYGKPVVRRTGLRRQHLLGLGQPAVKNSCVLQEGAMRGGYVLRWTFIDEGGRSGGACATAWRRPGASRSCVRSSTFRSATPLDGDLDADRAWPIANPINGSVNVAPAVEKAAQYWDVPVLRGGDDYQLIYFGWFRPKYREIPLPAGSAYVVDVIDTWNMTVETLPDAYENSVRVDLGRQYMAVRIRKA
ncbi:MAG: DUF5605 domain-containing protein [Bifidobacterium dentium]